jgi:hypothetical protein
MQQLQLQRASPPRLSAAVGLDALGRPFAPVSPPAPVRLNAQQLPEDSPPNDRGVVSVSSISGRASATSSSSPRPRFCHQCGSGLVAGSKFCSNCGAAVVLVVGGPPTPPPSHRAPLVQPPPPAAARAPAPPLLRSLRAAPGPASTALAGLSASGGVGAARPLAYAPAGLAPGGPGPYGGLAGAPPGPFGNESGSLFGNLGDHSPVLGPSAGGESRLPFFQFLDDDD